MLSWQRQIRLLFNGSRDWLCPPGGRNVTRRVNTYPSHNSRDTASEVLFCWAGIHLITPLPPLSHPVSPPLHPLHPSCCPWDTTNFINSSPSIRVYVHWSWRIALLTYTASPGLWYCQGSCTHNCYVNAVVRQVCHCVPILHKTDFYF